jgi:hypothetical protein
MSKQKYLVSFSVGVRDGGGPDRAAFIQASTKVGSRRINAVGPDEHGALAALKPRIAAAEAEIALRAQYPKTVEITL